MKIRKFIVTLVIAVAFLLSSTRGIQASIIVNGTGFVTQANGDQLESWLGEGPITITNIFTKVSGSTNFDFHNAANGMGRTFSVIEVSIFGQSQVIGGYNPQTWRSNPNDDVSAYNISDNLAERTAFLFNLTSNEKQNQNSDSNGQYQTYNYSGFGPTFGGGKDLFIGSSLNTGTVFNYSYGADAITAGGLLSESFSVARIEVFTISAVPEPTSIALFGASMIGIVLCRRKKKKAKV